MEFLIRKTKGNAFKFLGQKGQPKNLNKLEEHLFSVRKGKNFKFTERNKVLFKDFVQKPFVLTTLLNQNNSNLIHIQYHSKINQQTFKKYFFKTIPFC
jgi:hypothetical protein